MAAPARSGSSRLSATAPPAPSGPDLRAAFVEQFSSAAATVGVVERDHVVAGRVVRLRFAGDALVSAMGRALAHLAVPPGSSGEPDLTVAIWDSTSTGVDPPSLLPTDPSAAEGAWYFLHDEPLLAAYRPLTGVYSALDIDAGLGWHWLVDADAVHYWDSTTPLRAMFHWWGEAHGLQLVHSGAVGTREGGVLIAGKSGSGKSTTTLACVEGGLGMASDDTVLVDAVRQPEPWVHSLYGSAKLEVDHVRRFPALMAAIANTEKLDDEEAVTFVHERHPDRALPGFPLRALVLPKVVGGRGARLVPTSGRAGLAALAPSTILPLPGAGANAFHQMARLVARLPTYMLEVGPDVDAIVDAVRGLLAEDRR
jgi:hypothetical protein